VRTPLPAPVREALLATKLRVRRAELGTTTQLVEPLFAFWTNSPVDDAAVGDWLAGRLDAAEKGLLDIAGEHPLSAERHIVLRATYDVGGVQQAQGRLEAALRTYERGLEAAARLPNRASAGMPLVGLAEVAFQRDELVAAREHATAGVERCRRLAHTAPLVTGLLTLARIRWAEGDRARARAALDEAAAVMPVLEGLRNPVPAAQVRLALAAGDVTEAAPTGPRVAAAG
jgi:LuxR family maltose regulon positive regulatory protein